MSILNNFKNKAPISKRKKELLVIGFIGSIILATIFFYTLTMYSPIIPAKHPKINITYDGELDTDVYVDGTFELNSKNAEDSVERMETKIRKRGSSSGKGADRWPKKGFRIELSKPKSLLGMRSDDDWILFAMYLDYPRMKIKLAMDLWRSLLPENPTAILPESKYVVLYINGKFQGLYLLAEQNDRLLHNLNEGQDNIDTSLIIQMKGFTDLRIYDEAKYELDYPNIDNDVSILRGVMPELIHFFNGVDNDIFFDPYSGIYSKFDKTNLIDFLLFNILIAHEDFWDRNYFFIRNTNPSIFYLNPWDFDYCLGTWMGNERDPYNNPESEIRQFNGLYDHLMANEDFLSSCKLRWAYLRIKIWTEEFIIDLLSDFYKEIHDLLELDTEKWNPEDIKEDWKNDVDESVDYLFEWIPERLEFCDLYFGEF